MSNNDIFIKIARLIKEESNNTSNKRVHENFAPTAQEEAEKINSQTGAGYVTDQAFWEKQGIFTGEDLAISILNQTYSDLYKSVHNIRPRHRAFTTVTQAQAAIEDLDQLVQIMVDQEKMEIQQQAEYERERRELEELMPGEFDYEDLPMQTGMRRRMESKITTSRLQQIIKEELENMLQADLASEVEPVEGVWGGDPEGESGNLELPIDHSEAGGSEKITTHPETLDIIGDGLKEAKTIKLSKRQLEKIVKESLGIK